MARLPKEITRVMHEHRGMVHHEHHHVHNIVDSSTERRGNQPSVTSAAQGESEARSAFDYTQATGMDKSPV